MEKSLMVFALMVFVVFVSGCVQQPQATTGEPAGPQATSTTPASGGQSTSGMAATSGGSETPAGQATAVNWLNVEFRDVGTGETFRLSDFEGKVVVLETFAVWCPLCQSQQQEIQNAEAQLGREDVLSVSLDTDVNEDEARVLGHIQRNGFGWRFAVAPSGLSRELSDMFGLNVLNPPSTSVIILDRNQEPHLLRFGIKGSAEIVSEVQKYL